MADNLVPLLNCIAAAQREAKVAIEQANRTNLQQDNKFIVLTICIVLIALALVIIGLVVKLYSSRPKLAGYLRCPDTQAVQPIAVSVSGQQPQMSSTPSPARANAAKSPTISGVFGCGTYNGAFSTEGQKKAPASR